MSNVSSEVLTIIKNIFGPDAHKHNHNRTQLSYNCPVCDDGRDKGNLEINYGKLVMKCWKCGEDQDGLKGSLRKLVKNYGLKRDLQLYDSITEDFRPDYSKYGFTENYKSNIKLPEEYISLISSKPTHQYQKAIAYLESRGLGMEDIKRWDIGYCPDGVYGGRLIIPSYDREGKLNYFVARSYVGHRIPYKNPEVNKQEVIINHLSINWDSTVYLVEGMFDLIGLGLDNTIPFLGKVLHDKLFYEIIKNAKGNIIIVLDPDAKKNAYNIYRRLDNIPSLKGKVKVVDIPAHVKVGDKLIELDIAKIRELYKQRGILKILKNARHLLLEDYLENGI